MGTLAKVPTIITASRDNVNLFPKVLTNVCYPQVAISTIEAQSPNITETTGPDFTASTLLLYKRVICRNRIVMPIRLMIDIDSQDRTE